MITRMYFGNITTGLHAGLFAIHIDIDGKPITEQSQNRLTRVLRNQRLTNLIRLRLQKGADMPAASDFILALNEAQGKKYQLQIEADFARPWPCMRIATWITQTTWASTWTFQPANEHIITFGPEDLDEEILRHHPYTDHAVYYADIPAPNEKVLTMLHRLAPGRWRILNETKTRIVKDLL